MTIQEAKEKFGRPDRNWYVFCDACPLFKDTKDEDVYDEHCPLCKGRNCNGKSVAYEAIASYFNDKEGMNTPDPSDTVNNTNDVVNHPSHYCQGGMECIDEMILLFGKQAVRNFCLCNAWKYRKRAMFKNGQEDIDKSDWYIQKYKELSEGLGTGGIPHDHW